MTYNVTLTPSGCTESSGWKVLYYYLSNNSANYPRHIRFGYDNCAELGAAGVNITSVTIHGYARNSASVNKYLRMGFRESTSHSVAQWASIGAEPVLDSSFLAVGSWSKSGFGYNRFTRTYSGNHVMVRWMRQQFAAGQSIYLGVIQPDSGRSISVNCDTSEWKIDVTYELLGNIPTTDKTTAKLGETVTTTINRIIEDSTTTLNYKIGDTVIASENIGTATSHAFTIPEFAGEAFPNSKTATVTVEAVTSQSGTEYGTLSTSFTVTLPEDASPTASMNVSRVWLDGVSSASQIDAYVQKQSGVSAAITGTAKYGASIANVKLNAESSEYKANTQSATFTHLPFGNSGNITITATVTDTRGNTGTTTATVTVIPWSSPTIQTFTVQRATETGTIAIDGTCAKADATASVSSLITDGISVSAEWAIQQSGSGTASFDNIRTIRALDNLTVTRQDGATFQTAFPESVCAGTFDAQGNGTKTFDLLTLTGSEAWNTWGVSAHKSGLTGFYLYLSGMSLADASESSIICSHLPFSETWGGYSLGVFVGDSSTANPYLILSLNNDLLSDTSSNDAAIASLKSLLAAQQSAGTPVQVALQLGTAGSFTANPLNVNRLSDTDTFTSNADSITLEESAGEQNTLKFLIQYREIGSTDWISADTITATDISSTISGLLTDSGTILDTFNDMSGYEFRLCATDLYTSSYALDEMPTKEQFWDVDESTGKMGFGGDAPTEEETAGYRFHKPVEFADSVAFKAGYKTYSTAETDTGNKWIDGKTIYRLVATATTTAYGDSVKIADAPSGLETLVSCQAVVNFNTNCWRPIPSAYYGNDYWTARVWVENGTIGADFGSSWNREKNIIVIIEYTKEA